MIYISKIYILIMLENAHIKYIGFGSPLMDIIADVDLDFMQK
jgi:hypothetical protein